MTCLSALGVFLVVSGISMNAAVRSKKWRKGVACRDLRGDCNAFKNWNWCTTRQSTMKKICRMTCGFCGEKKCKDLRSDCHYLSSLGWCKSQKRSMTQICPVTCKLCPKKESLITTPRRPTTIRSTLPTTQPTTLRPTTSRPTTSHFTTPRPTTPPATTPKTEPPTTTQRYTTVARVTRPRNMCRDRRTDCKAFARLRWCVRRRQGMKIVCAATCGFCTTVPAETTKRPQPRRSTTVATIATTRKPTTTETTTKKSTTKRTTTIKKTTRRRVIPQDDSFCKDSRQDCNYLRRIGFCASRRSAMARMCPRTCQLCDKKDVRKLYQKRQTTTTTTTRPITIRYVTARRSALCTDKYGTPRCEYYRYLGWCDKDNNVAQNCFKTCKCSAYTLPSPCHLTPFGCCWDKRTPKRNRLGLGCPKCADDPRFIVLCDRFNAACQTPGGLGESVRQYCPRMCNFC